MTDDAVGGAPVASLTLRDGRRPRGVAAAVIVDICVGLVLVAGLWFTVPSVSLDLRVVQIILAVVVLIGFVTRRWLPWLATAVVALSTAAGWWLGVTGDPFLVAGFCLFVVAERFGTRRFPWWLGVAGAVLLVSVLVVSSDGIEEIFRGMLVGAIVLVTAWVIGFRTRQVRDEQVERARTRERMDLARDVHDVLSHALGTIGVRAGVVAHVQTSSPEELRTTLHEIEVDARDALGELRSLMSRERAGAASQPASASLDALVSDAIRHARSAGVHVRMSVDGRAEATPVGVRTTAHRIVQESVTNVIRHAHATVCSVDVRVDDDRLVVEVRDNGHGSRSAPTMSEGHGLVGMGERVALLGGVLTAGNIEGGYRVCAELPIDVLPDGPR